MVRELKSKLDEAEVVAVLEAEPASGVLVPVPSTMTAGEAVPETAVSEDDCDGGRARPDPEAAEPHDPRAR